MTEHNKNPQVNQRRFLLPDKDTFEYVFKRSKFGVLRAAQFIFTLVSWILVAHFTNNASDVDSNMIAFVLFAEVFSWLYSIVALVISLLVMTRRLDDLSRRTTIICCSLMCSVFCVVTSSLLADYVDRLGNDASFCSKVSSASCEQLKAAVVLGYLSAACFILDGGYELYILNEIEQSTVPTVEIFKDQDTTHSRESERRGTVL
ncbi:uncharacterized protein LOC135692094 [Rhopilema esculentum]|uniref:uncharacterized protein LOC135692094 n=1 Tax=Rhopilema esculentum TaxID=499914 RepID=UPI0031D8CEB5